MRDAEGKPTSVTRAEQVERDGGHIPMPELQAPYLLAWLESLGACGYGAAGSIPLAAAEILAWAECQRIALRHWEFEALRRASRAYVLEAHEGRDLPPYGDPDETADPATVDEQLERMFDRLAES